VLALSIGSAWTVAGTLGVGLIGIANLLGVSPEITAGAVISGAYFGDKMSPLSETTNLAPAVAGSDLFTHIKNMLWTTLPSILIALVIFAVIGLRGVFSAPLDLTVVLEAIESIFNVGLLTLIPLLVVLIMSLRRIAAFSTILVGALVGGLMAVILQPEVVLAFVDDPGLSTPVAMVKGIWSAMATGFVVESPYEGLNVLFSRGGMASMLETVWLIISAMAFGGVMEATGLLARLIQPVLKAAKTDRSLLVATGLTSIGINIVAGDQYMAIVLPGRMYRDIYNEKGIAPETLSRQIEDTGTITSPLIPWNSCGAYMSATLGIATFAYLPYCFFNLINVAISLIYAVIGFQIKRIKPEEAVQAPLEKATLYGIGGHRVEPTEHEAALTS
jgi:NhaC family Na+:H+ antiporter